MSQKQEQDQKKSSVYDLRAVLEEIELDLIRNLQRNLKRHEKEEEEEGFRWEMWQKAKLRNIAKYRKKNKEIVGERSKEIEDLINKTLQENFDTAESLMEKLFRKIKSFFTRRGMKYPKDISNRGLEKRELPEENFFDVNEKKIDALQKAAEKPQEPQKQPEEKPQPADVYVPEGKEKELTGKDNDQKLDDLKVQVNKDMKEVEGAIWRRMDDIYRQTIYKTEMFMAAGAKSLDQAIDMATKEFLDGGIDCIEYSNGRRVNIAAYAEMALRTASQRATFLAEGKKRDEWGIHTIFVSAHANTCPKCEPWQGKVLVDDVFSSGTAAEAAELRFPLLSVAMKAGLLHPNCRHTLATYFPDITILPKVPDKDKALKTYEAEQKQRALERKIRKAKRKVVGACDNDNIGKAQAELKKLQEQMQEHLDKHPELRRAYNREKIYPDPIKSGTHLGTSSSADAASGKPEELGEIDSKDTDQAIEYYNEQIRNQDAEHSFVIDQNGKVYYSVGNNDSVSLEGIDLSGATITHNHPSSNGILSFGKNDFEFLQANQGIRQLIAVNEQYTYSVRIIKSLENLSYSDYYRKAMAEAELDPDFDIQHKVFEILDREGIVKYDRKRIDI